MKVVTVLNRKYSGLRLLSKKVLTAGYQAALTGTLSEVILPEYDSFAGLLDCSPLVISTGDKIDWATLKDRELLIWEWGWTAAPARTLLEIKKHCDIPTLMFPGPIDRFWRELAPRNLDLQFEAALASNAIGVMLGDTVSFYRDLVPSAYVFHLPVPVDTDHFRASAVAEELRDRRRVLLTAPTRFTGLASQLPIATFVAFQNLLRRKPELEGLCFVYDAEERAGTTRALRALGLSGKVEIRSYLRPIQRYLAAVGSCWAGLSLPHGLLQGRSAMTSACLGIPMVLSEEIETHRILFPRTTVRWYDTENAADLCLRLLEDEEFRDDVVAEAKRFVEFYSVERCRLRLQEGALAAFEKHRAGGGA